jgi:hypothetical protein
MVLATGQPLVRAGYPGEGKGGLALSRVPVLKRYGARVAAKPGRRGNLTLFSRALFSVALAALAALIVRLRGSGGTPPHHGGWRELSVTDLEPADKP